MAVAPDRLDHVAGVLAGYDEPAFVAATTGRTNLVAHTLCPDPGAPHRYLTHRLEAVQTLETAPVLRTVKAAGPLTPGRAGAAAPDRRARRSGRSSRR